MWPKTKRSTQDASLPELSTGCWLPLCCCWLHYFWCKPRCRWFSWPHCCLTFSQVCSVQYSQILFLSSAFHPFCSKPVALLEFLWLKCRTRHSFLLNFNPFSTGHKTTRRNLLLNRCQNKASSSFFSVFQYCLRKELHKDTIMSNCLIYSIFFLFWVDRHTLKHCIPEVTAVNLMEIYNQWNLHFI